jgi:hypothetical protein
LNDDGADFLFFILREEFEKTRSSAGHIIVGLQQETTTRRERDERDKSDFETDLFPF